MRLRSVGLVTALDAGDSQEEGGQHADEARGYPAKDEQFHRAILASWCHGTHRTIVRAHDMTRRSLMRMGTRRLRRGRFTHHGLPHPDGGQVSY